MAVIPSDRTQQILFCEQHLAPWNTNAAAIGLVAADVTNLSTKTTAARAAFNAALAARQAAKAATEAYYNAAGIMTDKAREMVKAIKLQADAKNDPNVYVLAQIPAPTPPVPGSSAPPGKPEELRAILNPDGSVTLNWKSVNAASSTGASFTVARRFLPTPTNPTPAFVVIGSAAGSGASELGGPRTIAFTDTTIPIGSPGMTYLVTPKRGGKAGESSEAFTVTFGGGGMSFTVSAAPANFTLAA